MENRANYKDIYSFFYDFDFFTTDFTLLLLNNLPTIFTVYITIKSTLIMIRKYFGGNTN